MSTDSNSILTKLNSLHKWLEEPETQRLLLLLKLEAEQLQDLVFNRVPGEKINSLPGDTAHEKLLREQSIGEFRGLTRLQRIIDIELETLREQVELTNQQTNEQSK